MELIIVGVIVGAALAYIGRKTWNMVKRGSKGGGCSSCGTEKSSCANCPLVKR